MRDLYLIGGMGVVAIAIGAVLYFFGPSSLRADVHGAIFPGTGGTPYTVPFTILEQGDIAYSIQDRSNYRITSQSDLADLWALIYGSQTGPGVPTIDFSKYEVLAVFDGSHATDGYAIDVEQVADQNAKRTITVLHSSPDPRCSTKNTGTSPYEIIEVPATPFTLSHSDQLGTTTCAY